MCKKKILSLSAAAAVLSTGALAFESNYYGEAVKFDPVAAGKYVKRVDDNYNVNVKVSDNNSVSRKTGSVIRPIVRKGPGELGDALIFPAFFGGLTDKERNDPNNKKSDWHSEFSVVNTSDKAIVAKVVLYGKVASQELRDFNIYLSAHDVFRAKLEHGRLISSDGSTVAKGKPTRENIEFNPGDSLKNKVVIDQQSDYKYDYDAVMADENNELNISIDPNEDLHPDDPSNGLGIFGKNENDFEHEGYIVVYAMAEANASYHAKDSDKGLHKELWEDYRHLVDTCRDAVVNGSLNEWKDGIEGGLYVRKSIFLPNVQYSAEGTAGEVVSTPDQAKHLCEYVFDSEAYKDKDGKKKIAISFKTPSPVLTGSILVSQSGDDGRGTRDMLVKAYAVDNFTDPTQDQILLWTEGEFAHIADRCLYSNYDKNSVIVRDANGDTPNKLIGMYDKACVERDSAQFWLDKTYYEYTSTDPDLSRLVVTQPYKRILVQFGDRVDSKGNHLASDAYAWHEAKKINSLDRRRYGTFDLAMNIYDDDEKSFRPTLSEFIVSPATAGTSSGIPYEVSNISIFATMKDDDRKIFEQDFKQGYAVIEYKANKTPLSGIVTQMSAHVHPEAGYKAEVNWIYPFSEYIIKEQCEQSR
jgi:hypothetical protein